MDWLLVLGLKDLLESASAYVKSEVILRTIVVCIQKLGKPKIWKEVSHKRFPFFLFFFVIAIKPHGMCYSHFGNGICNGALFITQWGFISGCYRVKSISQWGKILVMTVGFVDHFGQRHFLHKEMTLQSLMVLWCYILGS